MISILLFALKYHLSSLSLSLSSFLSLSLHQRLTRCSWGHGLTITKWTAYCVMAGSFNWAHHDRLLWEHFNYTIYQTWLVFLECYTLTTQMHAFDQLYYHRWLKCSICCSTHRQDETFKSNLTKFTCLFLDTLFCCFTTCSLSTLSLNMLT